MNNEEISKELLDKSMPIALALYDRYFAKLPMAEVEKWQEVLGDCVDKDHTVQELLFFLDIVKTIIYQPHNLDKLRANLHRNPNN